MGKAFGLVPRIPEEAVPPLIEVEGVAREFVGDVPVTDEVLTMLYKLAGADAVKEVRYDRPSVAALRLSLLLKKSGVRMNGILPIVEEPAKTNGNGVKNDHPKTNGHAPSSNGLATKATLIARLDEHVKSADYKPNPKVLDQLNTLVLGLPDGKPVDAGMLHAFRSRMLKIGYQG